MTAIFSALALNKYAICLLFIGAGEVTFSYSAAASNYNIVCFVARQKLSGSKKQCARPGSRNQASQYPHQPLFSNEDTVSS